MHHHLVLAAVAVSTASAALTCRNESAFVADAVRMVRATGIADDSCTSAATDNACYAEMKADGICEISRLSSTGDATSCATSLGGTIVESITCATLNAWNVNEMTTMDQCSDASTSVPGYSYEALMDVIGKQYGCCTDGETCCEAPSGAECYALTTEAEEEDDGRDDAVCNDDDLAAQEACTTNPGAACDGYEIGPDAPCDCIADIIDCTIANVRRTCRTRDEWVAGCEQAVSADCKDECSRVLDDEEESSAALAAGYLAVVAAVVAVAL